MPENPWAYSEARDRIRDKMEKETIVLEKKKEDFEVGKIVLRKKKSLDISTLRRQMETGKSLDNLKSEVKNALKEGMISRDTYNEVIASIEKWEDANLDNIWMIDPLKLPFSQNALATFFEKQPLWENIWSDIAWFLYGFVVQGSAILVIIAWKIFTDFLFLPRDLYREFKSNNPTT